MAMEQTTPGRGSPILPQEIERESLLPSSSGRSVSEPPFIGVHPLTASWWREPVVVTSLKNLGLILLWYFLGTFLSLWNKLLLGKDNGLFGNGAFPAPFLLTSGQFFFQHLIARGLLASGVVRRRVDDRMTWRQYMRVVLPNGVATGLDIGFSNFSLVFITLSFYVMCKSTTPLFLLTFAILWGIERPSWHLAAVVTVITCGLLLLVAGETKFNLVGFLLVMSAAALSGLRWTITQVLLQGNRTHASTGGPVEVLYQLTPVMGITLGIISLCFEKLWDTLPVSPYFATSKNSALTFAIFLMGAIIAFAMVWAEFTLIANTSALTFMVAGTFKEIVTVVAAVVFLHESFTLVNAMGLVVLIMGVVLFNYLKYQRLRQREPRPLVLAEEGRYTAVSDGKDKAGLEEVAMVTGSSTSSGTGSSQSQDGGVEMVANVASRPPSPHMGVTEANNRHRRAFLATEEEEGGGGSAKSNSSGGSVALMKHPSI